MALVLDATPAGVNANSYCTRAEADAYHEARLNPATTWTDADGTTKDTALVTATRLLDEWYEWESYPFTELQRLDWPRYTLLDRNQRHFIDNGVIPATLKEATAELAMQLIAGDRLADDDVANLRVSSLRAGPVSFTFRGGASQPVIPDAVRAMIPSWWGTLRGTGGLRLRRA